MKHRRALSLVCSLGLWAASAMPAAAETAPVSIVFKSYRAFTNSICRIIEAGSPGMSAMAIPGLESHLGISGLKGIDPDRPWHVLVWLESTSSRPGVSIMVPTKDFSAFKAGLGEGSLLKGNGVENAIRDASGYAAIWLPGATVSKTGEANHESWKPTAGKTYDRALQVEFVPNDAVRNQALQSLGMFKMIASGAMASQGGASGMDPKALGEIINVYFEILETGLAGLEKLEAGLDARDDNLNLSLQVRAKSDSKLAPWFRSTPGNLDGVAPYAGDKSAMSFAMRFDSQPGYLPMLKKLVRAGMQVQGLPADSDLAKDMDQLFDKMLPLKAGGEMDMNQGMIMSGIYQFPGRDMKDAYGSLRKIMDSISKSQVGEGKPYKTASFQEAKRKSGSTSVDLVTFEMNFDSPMFKAPGQKEMMESFWKGGRMEFEYALQGDNLFFASPSRMDGLLAAKPTGKSEPVGPSTVAVARFNLVKMLPTFMGANPMVPAEMVTRAKGLSSEGTDVRVRLDLDGTFKGSAVVPLKMISSMAKLGQN